MITAIAFVNQLDEAQVLLHAPFNGAFAEKTITIKAITTLNKMAAKNAREQFRQTSLLMASNIVEVAGIIATSHHFSSHIAKFKFTNCQHPNQLAIGVRCVFFLAQLHKVMLIFSAVCATNCRLSYRFCCIGAKMRVHSKNPLKCDDNNDL